MDVVAVHQGGDGVLFSLAAQDQALDLGQIFSLPPLSRPEGNVPVGAFELLFCGPAGGAVLAVPDGLGLDAVEGTAGVGGKSGDQQERRACHDNKNHCGLVHEITPLHGHYLFGFLLLFLPFLQFLRLIFDRNLGEVRGKVQPRLRHLAFAFCGADARGRTLL